MVELEFRVIYVRHLDRDPTVILVLLGHRRQPRCLVRQQRSVLLRMLLLLSHARQSLIVSFNNIDNNDQFLPSCLPYNIHADYYQKEKERKGSIDQENDILISVNLSILFFSCRTFTRLIQSSQYSFFNCLSLNCLYFLCSLYKDTKSAWNLLLTLSVISIASIFHSPRSPVAIYQSCSPPRWYWYSPVGSSWYSRWPERSECFPGVHIPSCPCVPAE